MTTVRVTSSGTRWECVGSSIGLIESPDGPLLVRGADHLVEEDGTDHGVQRPVVALCRCGASTRTPWCDGMHKLLERRDRTREATAARNGPARRNPRQD